MPKGKDKNAKEQHASKVNTALTRDGNYAKEPPSTKDKTALKNNGLTCAKEQHASKVFTALTRDGKYAKEQPSTTDKTALKNNGFNLC